MAAYDLVEIYCELIAARLPMIESQKYFDLAKLSVSFYHIKLSVSFYHIKLSVSFYHIFTLVPLFISLC